MPPRVGPEPPQFSVLGVRIDNVTRPQAIALLEEVIRRRDTAGPSPSSSSTPIRSTWPRPTRPTATPFARATSFSADGTGVRWAARLQGVRVAENLVGTDFVPVMFQATAGRGYSYFMLGADPATVAAAADYARRNFPGWTLAGCHHGYLSDEAITSAAIEQSTRPGPTCCWWAWAIRSRSSGLAATCRSSMCRSAWASAACSTTGRATSAAPPAWLRRAGHEWLWRLFQQPRLKARRYLIGNPLFLARVLRERWGSRNFPFPEIRQR